jgi:hypothetical protein
LLDAKAPVPNSTTLSQNAEEVLAYLPPARIGQNIFSYAQWLACGCGELPRVGHSDDRPEGKSARPICAACVPLKAR